MNILSVTTRNFKNLPDRKWELHERFQAVIGLNEAGKSSLLEAIVVGLYGDATSADSRYEGMRRWNSPEHIYVVLDLVLEDSQCKIERDFESGKNTLTVHNKSIRAKDKVRAWLELHLPLPSEKAFLETACIKQNEIDCDIDASDLRTQIEQHSLSSTGQDIEDLCNALERTTNELQKGVHHPAKYPGPIKQVSDDLVKLQQELVDLEQKESEANRALVEYEQVAAQVEKLEAGLSQHNEHLRLDREFLDADRAYKQRSGEIPSLQAKIERLKALPQILETANREQGQLQASLAEIKLRQEKAQLWLRRRGELSECERSLAELAGDIARLKACDDEMKALKDPLQSTRIIPEEFSNFRALQKQLAECKSELDREDAESSNAGAELVQVKKQLGFYAGPREELNAAIQKLKSERETAAQTIEAQRNHESVKQEKLRVAAKLERVKQIDSERIALEQELATYKSLDGIDARAFRGALSSAKALEGALKDEGIGFEIDPTQPIQITIQVDGGAREDVMLERARKFVARREILAHVPGLATLHLTNESQTARKLAEHREEITSTLARASSETPDDLLRRFERRGQLADRLTASTVKLQTAAESRAIDEWESSLKALDKQLGDLSERIAKVGVSRGLSAIDQDLQASQSKLNGVMTGTAQAEARIQFLTQQLDTLARRTAERRGRLGGLQNDIAELLKRAAVENEAGLSALEQAYLEYRAKTSEIQMKKAQVLSGRLEPHIYSRRSAEEEKTRELTKELDRLAADALPDEKLKELGTQIEGLEKKVRAAGDSVIALKKEKQLLEADQLEQKFNEAVTQAAIAEAKKKEYEGYAFSTPGERLECSRQIEKLQINLKELHKKRAELKVKSDAAGASQSRIADLKETIADHEHRLERLKQRFETDSCVLEYVQKARDKAFADLLAAIPSGVGELFRRITAGKYIRVEGTGFTLQPWSADKGGTLQLREMSGGTSDQFYLSLRLEALRAVFREEVPPFILDDALVSADPQRRAAILSILEEYSAKGQVIFLTCQDWPELSKFRCLHLG